VAFALTRRRLLQGAAGAALGLGQLRGLAHAQMQSVTVAPPPDWRGLARLLSGELLEPDAPNFARIASPWNLRFASVVPAGIARCASPEDVAICLLWAQRNDMPLAIRGSDRTGVSLVRNQTRLELENQERLTAHRGAVRIGRREKRSRQLRAGFARAATMSPMTGSLVNRRRRWPEQTG